MSFQKESIAATQAQAEAEVAQLREQLDDMVLKHAQGEEALHNMVKKFRVGQSANSSMEAEHSRLREEIEVLQATLKEKDSALNAAKEELNEAVRKLCELGQKHAEALETMSKSTEERDALSAFIADACDHLGIEPGELLERVRQIRDIVRTAERSTSPIRFRVAACFRRPPRPART